MGAEHPRGAAGTHRGVCVRPPHPGPWVPVMSGRFGAGIGGVGPDPTLAAAVWLSPGPFRGLFWGDLEVFGGFWLLGLFVAHVGKELEGVCKQRSVCVPSAPWSVTPGMGHPRDGSPQGRVTLGSDHPKSN